MQERGTATERLGRFLRDRRLAHGWKVQALAKRGGLDKSYLSRIERGLTSERGKVVPRHTLAKLSVAYDVGQDELERVIGGAEDAVAPSPRTMEELLEQARMVAPVAIPVIAHPAHAGHSGTPVIDYVYADRPFAVNRQLLCIPVNGDCMAPEIGPGDRVIVDRELWPEQGAMVVAVVNEEVYVRRFYLTNSHIVLRAASPDHPDIEAEEADVVGVVVEIRRRPGKR